MKLERMTKAQLIAELQRMKKHPAKAGRIVRPKVPRPKGSIIAGCDIYKDDLLVVDEAKLIAYVHPEVQTVAGKIRIHGYAARSFRKGQVVRIRHWLTYDPPQTVRPERSAVAV